MFFMPLLITFERTQREDSVCFEDRENHCYHCYDADVIITGRSADIIIMVTFTTELKEMFVINVHLYWKITFL